MFRPSFVGRAPALGAAAEVLAAPTGGIAICGPPGMGVSRVLREILADQRARGRTVTFHRLPDPRLGDDDGGGGADLVVVDDAHHADVRTIGRLHDLALTTRVALGCHPHLAPASLTWMWLSGLVERIDLTALSLDELDELLRSGSLADDVHRATLHTLHRESGGRPGFIIDLVRTTLAQGELQRSTAMWRSVPDLGRTSELTERVTALVADLGEEQRRAVETLAVAGSLAVAGGDGDAVQGTITDLPGVIETRDGRCSLAPPVIARMIRATMGATRRAGIAHELALHHADRLAPPDHVRVAADAGLPVDPSELREASRDALRRGDAHSAVALAERVADGLGHEGALFHAGMLADVGQRAAAEERYAALAADPSCPASIRLAAGTERCSILLWDLGQPDLARVVAAQLVDATAGSAFAPLTRAFAASVTLMGGDPASALAAARAGLDDPAHDETSWRIDATTTLAAGGLHRGGLELSAAELDRLDRIMAANHASETDAATHMVCLALALEMSGHLGDARARLLAAHDAASAGAAAVALAWLALALARIELASGRLARAARWADEAAFGFADLGHHAGVRWAAAARLVAAAQQGDTEAARRQQERLDAIGPSGVRFLDPDLLRAKGWGALAAGDDGRARDLFASAADAAADSGAVALEFDALYDAARIGRVDLARMLAVAARLGDGGTRSRMQHVRGLTEHSPIVLRDAWRALAADDRLLAAAEAATRCSIEARRSGHRAMAHDAAAEARRLSARCGPCATPGLTVGPMVELTPREQQIARLAADGSSSKAIADRLHLSVRSVDNLLYRVYGKLGVEGRAALATVLEPPAGAP